MGAFIAIVIIIAFVLVFSVASSSLKTRQRKIYWGNIQILNDGTLVETKYSDIEASSDLPFNGSIKASFFASYLTLRESGFGGNYYALVSAYLFKWETEGILETKMTSGLIVYLTFKDDRKPTGEIELELYEILKTNGLEDGNSLNCDELHSWVKKILALGEQELLETGDAAFDQQNRIRFTKKGYYKSLNHNSFIKCFENLTLSTFSKIEYQRQLQELSFALLLDFTEGIANLVEWESNTPELLQIANRVWRIFAEERALI